MAHDSAPQARPPQVPGADSLLMLAAQLVGGRNLKHFDVDAALAAEAEEPDGSSSTGFEEEVSTDTLATAVLLKHPRVRARPRPWSAAAACRVEAPHHGMLLKESPRVASSS